ncbi:sphingomyelin phosphodiesterase [Hyalella azteca]|uniref:Sphingomyelin phosphodiesterase n=1 Tax=Hyalella azteca TaxID=294128 RepID=A0A8B7MZC2_HYAAZ|nr:sphingomyelin phosphodiesterase [Hyalella azteca]
MYLKIILYTCIVALLQGQLLVAHGFIFQSPEHEEKVDVGCRECHAAVASIEELLSVGASEQELETLAIEICIDFHLFIDDVCVEMVQLAAPQVLYVLNTTEHDVDTVCHVFFGTCKSTLPPWSIDVPGGKPDVVPPVVGDSTYRILHLSDTHFDPEYTEGTISNCDHPSCCRDWNDTITNDTVFAGRWGSERGSCDPPLRTVEAALEVARTLNPDIIYVTGDLSPHVVWMLTEEDIRASVVDTAAVIRRYFPDTPVAYTLGNHETVPVNSFPVPDVYPDGYSMDWLYPLLETVWGDGGVPESAMDTVRRGGYYHWSPVPGLRVVSLNVNYGYHENWFLLINHVDPTGQLEWLAQVLLNAEAAGEKVHIIGHIPIGSLLEAFSHNMNLLITRFESTIAAIFVGHSHFDKVQLHWDVDNNTRPVSIAYFAPSLSSDGLKSPSFRMYEVDGPGGSWTVLESLTYSMNLTLANAGADPAFPLAYSATEAYDLPDLWPASWADLVFQMTEDDDLFNEFYGHYWSFWADPPELPDCGPECRADFLCPLVGGDRTDDEPCLRIKALVPGYYNVTESFVY